MLWRQKVKGEKIKQMFMVYLQINTVKYNVDQEIGLHHPLDGVTNPEYKLLCFIQPTNFFLQREEGTSF
jgi:hypothetical protein